MEAIELDASLSTNNDSFNQSSSSQIVYYGVNILDGNNSDSIYGGSPHVFNEKSEALQIVKKHRGARFKGFASRDEAVTFSTQLQTSTPDKSKVLITDNCFESVFIAEKSSPFKSLKSQETVKFRKFIEAGSLDVVNELAWSNPRYLISSGDTPTVLQEGFHYNALHVAAKCKQGDVFKVILFTIENDVFLKLLFKEDSNDIFNQRKKFIIDLYLNLPDKRMCETPLHFSCKFGCFKAVEILLSHPSCDRSRVNKYGKTAREIICDRDGDAKLKKMIDKLFEAQYFIPVLRSEGNSIQPIIGKPFAINDPTSVIKNKDLPGPVNALLVIKAKAGPMPINKVNAFYKKWKTPTRIGSTAKLSFSTKANADNSIKLSDSDKGLERVGRQLSREFQVPWTEYWSFMDSWCDISCNEGLTKLERHLSEMRKIKTAEIEACNNSYLISESYPNSPMNQTLSPISLLCQKLERFHLHSTPQTNESRLENSRNSSSKKEWIKPVCARHGDIATKLIFDAEPQSNIDQERENISLYNIIKNSRIVENLSNFFIDFMIEKEMIVPSFENLMQLTKSSLEYLSKSTSNQNHPKFVTLHKSIALNLQNSIGETLSSQDMNFVSNACKSILIQDLDSSNEEFCVETESLSKTFFRRSVVPLKNDRAFLKKNLHCILKYLVKLIGKCGSFKDHNCQCLKEGEAENLNLTEDSSFDLDTSVSKDDENMNSSDSGDNEDYITPPSSRSSSPMEMPEEIIDIFIQGLIPSKMDMDVLHALESVEIDEIHFPSIKLWMHCLNCYPKEVHKMWESPALMKIRKCGPPASAPPRISSQINESAAKSFVSRFKIPKGACSTPMQRKVLNLDNMTSPHDFNDSISNLSF